MAMSCARTRAGLVLNPSSVAISRVAIPATAGDDILVPLELMYPDVAPAPTAARTLFPLIDTFGTIRPSLVGPRLEEVRKHAVGKRHPTGRAFWQNQIQSSQHYENYAWATDVHLDRDSKQPIQFFRVGKEPSSRVILLRLILITMSVSAPQIAHYSIHMKDSCGEIIRVLGLEDATSLPGLSQKLLQTNMLNARRDAARLRLSVPVPAKILLHGYQVHRVSNQKSSVSSWHWTAFESSHRKYCSIEDMSGAIDSIQYP